MRAAALFLMAALTASAQVHLPVYDHEVLKNGLTLDVVPVGKVPMMTIRVLVRGGLESVAPEPAGLAGITADLLRRGTEKRTAAQFARELDVLGANFTTEDSESATVITMDFLSKDLDKALDLLTDALMHPAFRDEEVSKSLSEHVESEKAMKDSPGEVIMSYWHSFFYGARHPYGHVADELSVANITRPQIESYHKRFYNGRNMIVIAAGSINPSLDGKRIAEAFSRIPDGEPYKWKTAEIPGAAGRSMLIVDKPDATQTNIIIGEPGIARTDPDRVPLMLVNTIFGGRFTSLLMQALRVDAGLTYGAYSILPQSHLRGDLIISTFTETNTTAATVEKALAVLHDFRTNGVTPDQLASAKPYVKGSYPTEHLETAEQLATTIGQLELYSLPVSDVNDLFAHIDAVDLATANAVMRKYYREDNLKIVLVGKAQDFRTAVKRFAPSIAEISIAKPGTSVVP